MKRIGLIIAIKTEMRAILKEFGEPKGYEEHGIFECYLYEKDGVEVIALHSGAGEIAASAGTQILISVYHVDVVGNFGIVGALTREVAKHPFCVVNRVVHYDMDSSLIDDIEPCRYLELPTIYIPVTNRIAEAVAAAHPEIAVVTCASADKFVSDPARKQELHDLYDCDICDMESAGIALTAYRNSIPCFMIKAVSDAMDEGAESYKEKKAEAAESCMKAALDLINQLGK